MAVEEVMVAMVATPAKIQDGEGMVPLEVLELLGGLGVQQEVAIPLQVVEVLPEHRVVLVGVVMVPPVMTIPRVEQEGPGVEVQAFRMVLRVITLW